MIDAAFDNFIQTLIFDGSIEYGNATNIDTPYGRFYKIEDPERPDLLCEDQGEAGKALFIFEFFRGGQNALAEDQWTTSLYAEGVKKQIAEKKGIISYNGQNYRIWHNKTTGVIPINNALTQNNFYGAQFTVLLYWNII